jgi:hypothetical protein
MLPSVLLFLLRASDVEALAPTEAHPTVAIDVHPLATTAAALFAVGARCSSTFRWP